MQSEFLRYRKGSYRKSFILILLFGVYYLIDSLIKKDLADVLIALAIVLFVLRQVVIPVNLNQNVLQSKETTIDNYDSISDYYYYANNYNKFNYWHRAIIFGDKLSFSILIVGMLCELFI